MVEKQATDSVSRRNVLKTTGGFLGGATVVAGNATAKPDPNPVKIKDVDCDRDGGEITLSNTAGFQINPWILVRIVDENGTVTDSITLGPGASATREGFENGTYVVKTFVDEDRDTRIEEPVFVGEESVEIDCQGRIEFELEYEPHDPVVGEEVVFRGVPSREPDRGLDYYWDINAGEQEGFGGSLEGSTDEPRFEHRYDEPGEYEVELTVELLDESELTETTNVTVREA